jgi:hypothetical protein
VILGLVTLVTLGAGLMFSWSAALRKRYRLDE